MLSRDSSEYLKDYQKQFMPEDADAGMILAFLDDFKGDRVCSKLLWKEALHRDCLEQTLSPLKSSRKARIIPASASSGMNCF